MNTDGQTDRQTGSPFEIQQRLATDSELPTIRLEDKEGSVSTDSRVLGRGGARSGDAVDVRIAPQANAVQ
jgi:hypothetical protein